MGPQYDFPPLTFRIATKQADSFLAGLGPVDRGRFTAAAEILANSVGSGRPPGNRWAKIKSASDLYELKVTAPGSPGPQHRLICARQGSEILVLHGFTKHKSAIPARAIAASERALALIGRQAGDSRAA